ncbi:hypothetical protein KFL_002820190 [Klebsormidium nitens]|uniref:EGF-like domain-containing protein n=1 Tax=Klebsormidium nitens TaxID=105231 RepID=A0A1Y1I724_KLENI|nr:hypothetical protein KFL_002820190 [Klebsormidium nitens]|eukprot:GAQ86323.1 hypothetical protein KFL_002820190 [Klebsormidium nitens]
MLAPLVECTDSKGTRARPQVISSVNTESLLSDGASGTFGVEAGNPRLALADPLSVRVHDESKSTAQVEFKSGQGSGFDSGLKSGLDSGLESGLLGDAHPGYGRVAAAALLGFDRLKRPQVNTNPHSHSELLGTARETAAPENKSTSELDASTLEEKSKEVEKSMTGVITDVSPGSEVTDKFAEDDKRAADIARYKVLIGAAVRTMDKMNARLWRWGSISGQLQNGTGEDSDATQSKGNGSVSKVSTVEATASSSTDTDVTSRSLHSDQNLIREEDANAHNASEENHRSLGSTACSNDCSNQGRCISRRCVCKAGYGGVDCSQAKQGAAKYRGFSSIEEKGIVKELDRKLQVCFVTNEVAGPITNGGIGTAFTTMAYSLAERGHQVTILFTMGKVSMRGTFQEWVLHYAKAGIALLGLQRPPPGTHHVPKALIESHEVLRFLRERSFDVVHFPDYQGAGYYSVLAKKQGLALKGTALVVGVHGPSFWAKKAGNGEPITAVRSLEGNFMEQRAVALADYVVAPSQYILQWMESEGWQLDLERTFVQPNLLPKTDWSPDHTRGKPRSSLTVFELVFFGRLETRKGAVTFCDAIDEILGGFTEIGDGSLEVLESPKEADEGESGDRSKGQVVGTPLTESAVARVNNETQATAHQRIVKADEARSIRMQLSGAQRAEVLSKLERVTFLGRSAIIEAEWGVEYVQRRARRWGALPWKIVTRMDPLEAKEYLRGPGRLAVMPSKVENSPYTVYECAELGIPFVAADVGGISDLIHPSDRPHALFEPTVQSLVDRLSRALLDGVRPARPAVDAAANENAWMTWHARTAAATRARDDERWARLEANLAGKDRPLVSVVMTHFNRPALCKQAIESLEAQDYPAESFEVVLVDDGSTQEDAIRFLDEIEPVFQSRGWRVYRQANAYLGAARNAGARLAKGKYILFMDDDNWAKPHEVSTYVRAMEWGGADVMTSFVDFFWSADARPPSEKDRPSYLFLGGSSDVGAFKNCFGDANCFVRKSSFFEIGGYTEDYGIGYEDWEMYANATLRGFRALLAAVFPRRDIYNRTGDGVQTPQSDGVESHTQRVV